MLVDRMIVNDIKIGENNSLYNNGASIYGRIYFNENCDTNRSLCNDKLGGINLVRRSKMKRALDMYETYYMTEDIFGNGISGNVMKCIHKQTGGIYAIKVLDKTPSSFREIYIQKILASDHIINLVDVFYDNSKIYAIMEYADGGDVFDKLCEQKLSESDIVRLLYNVSSLLKYVHDRGVIHGDVKLENILICKNRMRLCDFGFSVFENRPKTKRYTYTLPYTAPEHLNEMRYSFKSDVWSLGMIAYYFYYSDFPFSYVDGMSKYEVQKCFIENSLKFPASRRTSKFMRDLLSSMLQYEETSRISLPELNRILSNYIFG